MDAKLETPRTEARFIKWARKAFWASTPLHFLRVQKNDLWRQEIIDPNQFLADGKFNPKSQVNVIDTFAITQSARTNIGTPKEKVVYREALNRLPVADENDVFGIQTGLFSAFTFKLRKTLIQANAESTKVAAVLKYYDAVTLGHIERANKYAVEAGLANNPNFHEVPAEDGRLSCALAARATADEPIAFNFSADSLSDPAFMAAFIEKHGNNFKNVIIELYEVSPAHGENEEVITAIAQSLEVLKKAGAKVAFDDVKVKGDWRLKHSSLLKHADYIKTDGAWVGFHYKNSPEQALQAATDRKQAYIDGCKEIIALHKAAGGEQQLTFIAEKLTNPPANFADDIEQALDGAKLYIQSEYAHPECINPLSAKRSSITPVRKATLLNVLLARRPFSAFNQTSKRGFINMLGEKPVEPAAAQEPPAAKRKREEKQKPRQPRADREHNGLDKARAVIIHVAAIVGLALVGFAVSELFSNNNLGETPSTGTPHTYNRTPLTRLAPAPNANLNVDFGPNLHDGIIEINGGQFANCGGRAVAMNVNARALLAGGAEARAEIARAIAVIDAATRGEDTINPDEIRKRLVAQNLVRATGQAQATP